MTTKTKQWTVLGYLAGDNNLDSAAVADLREMETVGSSDEVNVIVQIDRAAASHQTQRFYVTKGQRQAGIGSQLLANLGETNTGDPKVICDYMKDTIANYPAEKTMLVLWNHGSGFYVPPDWVNTDGGATARELNSDKKAISMMRRSFFSTTRKAIIDIASAKLRGICYDDHSHDCLDNKELKQVLSYAQDRLAGRKLEVLGMDACLMTMIEVAYQVKDHARFLVGSEETEPANGWPYNTILADLTNNPAMDGAALAKTVVNRYVESYNGTGLDVTQAALDLSKLGDITTAIGELAKALLKAPLGDLEDTLFGARRRATSFYDDIYVDIHHVMTNIAAKIKTGPIHSAAVGVIRAIEGNGATSPIIAESHGGARMNSVKGLSMYWPLTKMPSTYYKNLDFAAATRWGDVLSALGVD